jgi:hypothetical protein
MYTCDLEEILWSPTSMPAVPMKLPSRAFIVVVSRQLCESADISTFSNHVVRNMLQRGMLITSPLTIKHGLSDSEWHPNGHACTPLAEDA